MPARFTTSTGPFFSANFVGLIHRRGGGRRRQKKFCLIFSVCSPGRSPFPCKQWQLYIRYMMQVYPSQRRWGWAKETFFRIWGNVPCHRHMRRQSTLSPCLLCIGKRLEYKYMGKKSLFLWNMANRVLAKTALNMTKGKRSLAHILLVQLLCGICLI